MALAREDLEGAATPGLAFERFVASDGAQLRRALVARYGLEFGVEAANDALSRAWADWDRVRPMENPAGYLYRVAQSAVRRYRRWGCQPAFPGEQTDDDRHVEPGLGAALAQLRPGQRVAVLLTQAHGYSYAEVAGLTGLTIDAVRNHAHRGMRRMRELLEVPDDADR